MNNGEILNAQKNWKVVFKAYGKTLCENNGVRQKENSYIYEIHTVSSILFISCKPQPNRAHTHTRLWWSYSTMQSDFYFIAIFFFWFPFVCVCWFHGVGELLVLFSGILFYFNRFELCENVEEWLIFHYRNTIHDNRSIP